MRRILLLHNRYRYLGGEDHAVEEELALLRQNGNEAELLLGDNRDTLGFGALHVLITLFRSTSKHANYRKVRNAIDAFQPDCIHAHNLWFSLGLSALRACRDANVPILMTLHNMRLFCPGGTLLRADGQPCRNVKCAGTLGCLRKRCYKGSFWASWFAARFNKAGWRQGAWSTWVDLFLTPSNFSREIAREGGLDPHAVRVLPHWLQDPLTGREAVPQDPLQVVYAGRISREKGVAWLLDAWALVHQQHPTARLSILGDGPLREELVARKTPGVEWFGRVEKDEVYRQIRSAAFLVQPSICYETFGLSLLEAFALQRPAIASRMGALPELVKENETGLLVGAGDTQALADSISTLLSDTADREQMGLAGRALYESTYRPDQGYEGLCAAMEEARARHGLRNAES